MSGRNVPSPLACKNRIIIPATVSGQWLIKEGTLSICTFLPVPFTVPISVGLFFTQAHRVTSEQRQESGLFVSFGTSNIVVI
jgi:hypothetical protein